MSELSPISTCHEMPSITAPLKTGWKTTVRAVTTAAGVAHGCGVHATPRPLESATVADHDSSPTPIRPRSARATRSASADPGTFRGAVGGVVGLTGLPGGGPP